MDPDVKENVNVGEWDLAYQNVLGENTKNSNSTYQHDLGQDEMHLNTGDVENMKNRTARGDARGLMVGVSYPLPERPRPGEVGEQLDGWPAEACMMGE